MDIKEILKEKIKNAKTDLDALVEGKTLSQVKASRMVARLMGETEAYNDSLTAIEQSQKPMKVFGYGTCPSCGYHIRIPNIASTWGLCPNYCPHCGQHLDWGEGEKK
jgi:hypothetical protein